MELIEALRTTGAVRAFTDEVVDDATLAAVLDNARFAPSGANAQAWHLVVVKDPEIRTHSTAGRSGWRLPSASGDPTLARRRS
jgi:nitroreductase